MYRVLIVDDIDILRYDLKRMKVWGETTGFAIEDEASDGREALKKLRESSFDLLITDIRMPVMDGMELLRAVSKENLCPCIVMLSDYTEYSYAREGLLHGAFDYLGKPVNQNDILELLGRAKIFLDQKKEQKEKITQWEDMAVSSFFPTQQVDKVVSLMFKDQKLASQAITELLDLVGNALENDSKKGAVILENAFESILTKLLKEYKWIELYVDVSSFRPDNLGGSNSWDELYQKVQETCSKLLEFLSKFVVWKQEDGVAKRAALLILNNISENTTIKDVADNLFISKAYLSELFKRDTGLSLLDYMSSVKIERAKYLLETTTIKNYEIAEMLGFRDPEYFSKVFKKHTGVPPSSYRKENMP